MANEILFTCKLNDSLQLEQHFNNQNDKILRWQTVLYNTHTRDSLILENIADYRPPFPDDQPQQRGHYLRVCGAALVEGTIYVIYQNYGFVSLKYYTFRDPKTFTIHEVPLSRVILTRIWGPLDAYASFKKIDDYIYFYLHINHAVNANLFRFQPGNMKISKVVFRREKVSAPQPAATSDLSKPDVVSTDVNLFEDINLQSQTKIVQDYLRPVVRSKNDITDVLSFAYLGFIDSSAEYEHTKKRYMSLIYFFSSIDKKLQITRYSSYDKEWLISPFVEEPLLFDPNHTGILK